MTMTYIQKQPSHRRFVDQESTFLILGVRPRDRVLTADGAAQRRSLSALAVPPRKKGAITLESDLWVTLGDAVQRVLASLERERADVGSPR